MGALLTRLLEIFYTKKLDIVVIGLENRYVQHFDCTARAETLLSVDGREMTHSWYFSTYNSGTCF